MGEESLDAQLIIFSPWLSPWLESCSNEPEALGSFSCGEVTLVPNVAIKTLGRHHPKDAHTFVA